MFKVIVFAKKYYENRINIQSKKHIILKNYPYLPIFLRYNKIDIMYQNYWTNTI